MKDQRMVEFITKLAALISMHMDTKDAGARLMMGTMIKEMFDLIIVVDDEAVVTLLESRADLTEYMLDFYEREHNGVREN